MTNQTQGPKVSPRVARSRGRRTSRLVQRVPPIPLALLLRLPNRLVENLPLVVVARLPPVRTLENSRKGALLRKSNLQLLKRSMVVAMQSSKFLRTRRQPRMLRNEPRLNSLRRDLKRKRGLRKRKKRRRVRRRKTTRKSETRRYPRPTRLHPRRSPSRWHRARVRLR